jgi:hypothetical protein
MGSLHARGCPLGQLDMEKLTRKMKLKDRGGKITKLAVFPLIVLSLALLCCQARAFDVFDVVPGVIESPEFKGKDPIDKLRMVADLLRTNRIKQSDVAYLVLDWGDQYLREPTDRLERLKRWSELANDRQLDHIKIPRDFLNRVLLAEYLVSQTSYVKGSPRKKLEILQKLGAKNLVDWSVALAYAGLYAGSIVTGAKDSDSPTPMEELEVLKKLRDSGLVGRHYWVPTEAILVSEVLAMDRDYLKASPFDRLVKLRELERKGLITVQTRKELEKLPVWRLLASDSSFLKADAAAKRERLLKLKAEGLVSSSTSSDLNGMFRPMPLTSPMEARPIPIPQKISPPIK